MGGGSQERNIPGRQDSAVEKAVETGAPATSSEQQGKRVPKYLDTLGKVLLKNAELRLENQQRREDSEYVARRRKQARDSAAKSRQENRTAYNAYQREYYHKTKNQKAEPQGTQDINSDNTG